MSVVCCVHNYVYIIRLYNYYITFFGNNQRIVGIFRRIIELYVVVFHACVHVQGRDGQTYARPSRPFPVLSDGTSLVAVSSLPKSV